MIELDITLGCKDGSPYVNQSTLYAILTDWRKSMIISLGEKKSFGQKSIFIMILKTLNKLGFEEMHLNIIKAICEIHS
jgi:hypothetical protein